MASRLRLARLLGRLPTGRLSADGWCVFVGRIEPAVISAVMLGEHPVLADEIDCITNLLVTFAEIEHAERARSFTIEGGECIGTGRAGIVTMEPVEPFAAFLATLRSMASGGDNCMMGLPCTA